MITDPTSASALARKRMLHEAEMRQKQQQQELMLYKM